MSYDNPRQNEYEGDPLIDDGATLTTTEAADLHQCEEIIGRNLETFVDCGNALLRIRDKRLYRADFPDFQAYCRERWQIGRSHAYRLIEAAEVASNVPEVETERQARELSKVEKDLQAEVWQIAVETAPVIDGKPSVTSGHLKALREVLTGVIEGGGLDDGNGEHKPLGTLLKAQVTEVVFERMRRQEQAIIDKREQKAKSATTAKEVPTLPAARSLMSLVQGFVRGIDRMNIDRGTKMHPALSDPYHFAKALLGEETGDTRLLIDDVTMTGNCEGCPDDDVVIRDAALTVNCNGNGLRSTRLKLCSQCIARYCGAMAVVPEGEVIER